MVIFIPKDVEEEKEILLDKHHEMSIDIVK